MISKRVLSIAAVLLLVCATSVMAQAQAVAYVDNFIVNHLSIDSSSSLILQSVHSYGIVTGDPTDEIYRYVKNGYAGGAWNGLGGISSSVAASDPNHAISLALVNGDDYTNYLGLTSFQNHQVASGDSLIRCTYYGDANMDGVVDSKDYYYIDLAYQHGGTAAGFSGWTWGDFNYDGKIDAKDYALINYVNSLHLPPIDSVPEPSTLVMLFSLAVGGLLLRRRRS